MLAQAGFQSRGRRRERTPVTPHYAPFSRYKAAAGRSRPRCCRRGGIVIAGAAAPGVADRRPFSQWRCGDEHPATGSVPLDAVKAAIAALGADAELLEMHDLEELDRNRDAAAPHRRPDRHAAALIGRVDLARVARHRRGGAGHCDRGRRVSCPPGRRPSPCRAGVEVHPRQPSGAAWVRHLRSPVSAATRSAGRRDG